MAGMAGDFVPDTERMRKAAGEGYSTATDLADWLVRVPGIAFRQAHHITANIVKLATEKGVALADLPLADMRRVEPRVSEDVFTVLSAEASKSGIEPDELPAFLELYPDIRGLMTMPPETGDAEASRPYFRRLRQLAGQNGLSELSMGTSQDYGVAAAEGATPRPAHAAPSPELSEHPTPAASTSPIDSAAQLTILVSYLAFSAAPARGSGVA